MRLAAIEAAPGRVAICGLSAAFSTWPRRHNLNMSHCESAGREESPQSMSRPELVVDGGRVLVYYRWPLLLNVTCRAPRVGSI